jgi:hypothetical protein
MSFEFSRELLKLEVRFGEYMKAEQEFVEHVKECIQVFKELIENLEKRDKTSSCEEIKKLSKLRREAIKSLGKVLKSESDIKHEKSHIFESYGALILCLDKESEEPKS